MKASTHWGAVANLLVACQVYSARISAYRFFDVDGISASLRINETMRQGALDSDDASSSCSDRGMYCAESVSPCPASRCLPCDTDPDGSKNGLTCAACGLDRTAGVPMCTDCEGGLVSLVSDFDASGSLKRWLCHPSLFRRSVLPGLCSDDVASAGAGWAVEHIAQAHELFKDNLSKDYAEVVKAEGPSTYSETPVKMRLVEGKVKEGLVKEAVIEMGFFRDTGSFEWDSAVTVVAFRLRYEDSWVRTSDYLKHLEEPTDDELCVWRVVEAGHNEHEQVVLNVAFVKPLLQPSNLSVRVPYPNKLMLQEVAVQQLGACFDYWMKGRRPREILARKAEEILWRARMYQEIQAGSSMGAVSSVSGVATACGPGEYCTFGPLRDTCSPPGFCLPCGRDSSYDFREYKGNGLTCSKCRLNTESGGRYSAPTCLECAEGELLVELKDDTGVRIRSYCRPQGYAPEMGRAGQLPGLCSQAMQGDLKVASLGELWWRQKGMSFEMVRVRMLPLVDGMGARFVFYPDTMKIHNESLAHWAGMRPEVLVLNFEETDEIAEVARRHAEQEPDEDREGSYFFERWVGMRTTTTTTTQAGHTAIFDFLGIEKKRDVRQFNGAGYFYHLGFNKEVSDEGSEAVYEVNQQNGKLTNVVAKPPTMLLSTHALRALAACVTYMQDPKHDLPTWDRHPKFQNLMDLAKRFDWATISAKDVDKTKFLASSSVD